MVGVGAPIASIGRKKKKKKNQCWGYSCDASLLQVDGEERARREKG